MAYIGIDPGKSGALAIIRDDGDVQLVAFDETAYIDALRHTQGVDGVRGCVVERVAAMPKQGVASMFSFGENYGYIRGVLATLSIPYEVVTPVKWKRAFGVTADKNTSVAVAQRLFPSVSLLRTDKCRKPHDGFAEALLMAEYARRSCGGAP